MNAKVLIVDDSALVRKVLKKELEKDSDIEVVGTARDPYQARDMIVELKPDVLTLDMEMPRMDGLTFLKKLMAYYPMPVIIVSSLTPKNSELAIHAMESGAVDVLCKPGLSYEIGDLASDLIQKIKDIKRNAFNLGLLKNSQWKKQIQNAQTKNVEIKTTDKVIVIGSSTGGTQAIEEILKEFPSNAPGTVIVQHMPAGFTKKFAERLNQVCKVEVMEASDNDRVSQGRVLIAPGGYHLKINKSGTQYFVNVIDGPNVNRHKPSVEVLFRSVAKKCGANAIGVMLTGMGEDGAKGMLEMKEAGAKNIAQNKETSVVFGMPGAAVECGAVDYVEPLDKIAKRIWDLL